MVRQDETPIHDAVREALVNTLTNADFYEPRGVVIEKYPDRIILENPGTVIVGKKQMLRGGISEPRNEAVMKMFNLIGFGERAGSGVPDIYATWEQAGYAEPKVEEIFGGGQPNRTILILPLLDKNQAVLEKGHEKGREKGHENDTQNDAAIRKTDEIELRVNSVYRLLKENPTISIAEIGRKLDLSDKQVRLALNNMKQNGRIKRDGSARSGKWITFD